MILIYRRRLTVTYMPKTGFNSVDEYIAAQPEPLQRILASVRTAIREAVPAAAESISYQMPAYKLNGEPLFYLAGWKRHYSLYPATERLQAAFKDELAHYKVEKSTMRFPLTEPVPVNLIGQMAKFREKELASRASAFTPPGVSPRRRSSKLPR